MLIMLAALATAVSPSPEPVASPTPAPVSEKKVCRSEPSLGSFLPKRVCHSAREWAAIDAGNADVAAGALARRRSGAAGRN